MTSANGSMLASVRESLRSLADDPHTASLRRLAERYATLMDAEPDDPRIASDLGPKLVVVLGALGIGGKAAGRPPVERGDQAHVPGVDALAELRAKRRGAAR